MTGLTNKEEEAYIEYCKLTAEQREDYTKTILTMPTTEHPKDTPYETIFEYAIAPLQREQDKTDTRSLKIRGI